MFRLATEFYKLPLRFDAARLREEVSQFSEPEWRAHPQGHADNSALPLVTVGGGMNDEVKGPMRPTPFLARCPYIAQVLASLGSPIGRARLMRIAGQSDAHAHVDTNYYWMHHVRVHIPALTYPQVQFLCEDKAVHMAPGESWIFDSWKLHNVLNPVAAPRIHLVADTVGSAHFWDLVARAERPFDPVKTEARGVREILFQPDAPAVLEFEEENFPLVMSPWEQAALAARMLEDVPERNSEPMQRVARRLERLHQGWHALWTRFGHSLSERGAMEIFRKTMAEFDAELPALAGDAALANGVHLVEALRQAIVRPAVNPEVLEVRARVSTDTPPASAPAKAAKAAPWFDRPVFIVAAPRSGSSMLFELLSRSPDFWTVGGESHLLFENIAKLHPAAHGWDSNRLTAADADEQTIAALHDAFSTSLRDHAGQPLRENSGPVRLLEKTPKNSLRIPFLAAAFPGARFIFLSREPAENISSILEAWRSGRFVMYPQLPGWTGAPWSMMLPPGWREVIGKPPAEIAARQWLAANGHILDDLAALPRDRWCAVSYAEVVTDPQSAAERLCAFAGVRWEQTAPAALPPSRYTLTPPAPEKWHANAAALAPVLPLAEPLAMRVREVLTTQAPPPMPDKKTPAATAAAAVLPGVNAPVTFDSQHTKSFPELLEALGVSLAVSTYQAGKLIFIRSQEGVLNTHFRDFQSPMGIAFDPLAGRLAVGARHEVWQFRNFAELSPKLEPPAAHDAVFVPAARFSTGDIRIHEIAWIENELWAVNTRFSCLCTFDGLHSFVPRWRPPFISALAAEDRCHLSGLAVVENHAAYVTCHGVSDAPGGWRETKARGGCLIEVHSGEIVTADLAMPHSPRFYAGRLWILESGHGRVSTVDLATGKTETFAELPGFTRGLDFFGDFAFIGLSQVRETAVFSGIPISEPGRERHCGVWVLDIRSGKTVAFLKFTGTVQEIFALHVLPGICFPELLNEDSDLLAGAFLVPQEALDPAPRASAGLAVV